MRAMQRSLYIRNISRACHQFRLALPRATCRAELQPDYLSREQDSDSRPARIEEGPKYFEYSVSEGYMEALLPVETAFRGV